MIGGEFAKPVLLTTIVHNGQAGFANRLYQNLTHSFNEEGIH
jgi:hypothetical protein